MHIPIAIKSHFYLIMQQLGPDFLQDSDDASQAEVQSKEVALWSLDNAKHIVE